MRAKTKENDQGGAYTGLVEPLTQHKSLDLRGREAPPPKEVRRSSRGDDPGEALSIPHCLFFEVRQDAGGFLLPGYGEDAPGGF
jgi:hypothetical protein